ncbi:type II toxin-antitoxin system PemK/MazF family toxin [Aeromicrobium sp. 179-A 4D2 NHS]|uniref:type II toxin-antitoxin system PemK/MazF family toxin n=1 Tax=Aeromicrobium sp. 179-A 4D2 NHS TaxID=3142375 RepID=UPI0039A043E6
MARASLTSVLRRLVQAGRTVASSAPSAPPARGGLDTTWAGDADGRPDPGEIVWTWVPYEDDPAQGKDRPVLLIGRRDASTLVGLQLTSKDHDRDAAQEARAGRHWMDIGSGAWDARGRASEVRLNRLIEVREQDVRREGAVLDRAVYERVVAAARQYLP